MVKVATRDPKQPPEPEAGTIWRDDLAKLFGLQQATMLDKLAREGLAIRAAQPGYFRLFETIEVYVPHLRQVAARYKSHDGLHDVAAESAQLKAAQRRLTELKIAKEQGDLISASELLELWGDLVKDVRSMMLSMPARV
jgi:phage terminase Nu1 subunit (DNA packaging protein)